MVVGMASVGCRCMLCISKSNALLLPLVSNPPNIGTDAHSAASGPSMSSSLSTALNRRRPPSSTCTSLPVLPLRLDYHRSTTEYGPNAGCVSWLLWPRSHCYLVPTFFFHPRTSMPFVCMLVCIRAHLDIILPSSSSSLPLYVACNLLKFCLLLPGTMVL